jgi:excisionase family DNA binding protein
MKHIEPPENLPVVPTPPVPPEPSTTEAEPKEDVHFRERNAGDIVEKPNNDDRCLGECPSTIKEASPMEHNDTRSATSAAFMTVDEVATWLGVSRYSVYALVRKDGMPCDRYAGTLRFKLDEIKRFLESRRASGDRHVGPQD